MLVVPGGQSAVPQPLDRHLWPGVCRPAAWVLGVCSQRRVLTGGRLTLPRGEERGANEQNRDVLAPGTDFLEARRPADRSPLHLHPPLPTSSAEDVATGWSTWNAAIRRRIVGIVLNISPERRPGPLQATGPARRRCFAACALLPGIAAEMASARLQPYQMLQGAAWRGLHPTGAAAPPHLRHCRARNVGLGWIENIGAPVRSSQHIFASQGSLWISLKLS